MFFKEKNEEKSQHPACKMNTLKTDISPSSDLPNLLSLLKINATHVVKCSPPYNHSKNTYRIVH